jgi:hypothetical protein
MNKTPPNIEKDLPEKFAFVIGKALQNFGSIEYLINEILSKLILDPLVHAHIIRMPISKRLEILDSYFKRDTQKLTSINFAFEGFTNKIGALFAFRNKIAHNPMVVKVNNNATPPSIQSIGVHVIRYTTDGTKEEWISHEQIENIVSESEKAMHKVNTLITNYP